MAEPLELRPVLPASGPPYRSHQVFHRVFTSAQCRRIAAMADRRELAAAALVGGTDDGGAEQIRRSTLAWIGYDDESAWIFERLAGVALRANARWGFDVTGFTEYLQLTHYAERGAFYTWHQDGLDGEVAGRKLSLVVQLSDPADYGGSALELLEVVEDFDAEQAAAWREATSRQGTVIAFPAFEYHRVTPLRRGRRRSLVCWLGGPPFR